jgi:glycosyltransferase involved in cell wall biosynthesis
MRLGGAREKLLVHFSGDDWWHSNPHSRHHITNQFYQHGYKVLWINPMGLRFPSLMKKGFVRKISNKISSLTKLLKREKEDFYVFTPFFLPVFSIGVLEKINTCLMYLQLRLVLWRIDSIGRVAFVTLPTFGPLVKAAHRARLFEKVIYYYSDQYDKYREIRDSEPIMIWDQMLREVADAIYCASQAILDSVAPEFRESKIVRVLSHQVDFDLFDYQNIEAMHNQWGSPIIGYFGSLTDSNDWEIIQYAATVRENWQFVFIGRKLIDLPELECLPNVHFTGYVPYENLPAMAVNFDVGIMFWRMTDWIKACSPLKLKEYLALGLPVVSVPIEEVVLNYNEYVEVAANGPQFVEAIDRCLGRNVKEKHRNFAKQYSWSAVFEEIRIDCHLG